MMTSSTTVQRRSKRHSRVANQRVEDRISRLPDSVLRNILNFLPTKDAVATSILSKRWKTVWTLVRNLCFDDRFAARVDQFQDFVHSVLASSSATIQKFSLRCANPIPMGLFDSWLSHAITRNVREMDIDLGEHRRMQLPASVYNSTTLEVLRLRSGFVVSVPLDGICFPSLKILQILLQQPNNLVTEKLFCSCPSLTELSILAILSTSDPPSNFIITSATLKMLTFVVTFAKFGGRPNNDHHVVIRTPNLEHLRIIDHMLVSYEVEEIQSIKQARLDVSYPAWSPVDPLRARHLGTGLTKTHFLTASAGVVLALERACVNYCPSFPNLTYLDIAVGEFGWKGLHTVLTGSSHLQTFKLTKKDWFELSDDELGWLTTEMVPPCLTQHINKIEMKAFTDGKAELRLVEYFLRHCQVLHSMSIWCHGSVRGDEFKTFCRKVLKFGVGSPSADIRIASPLL